MLYFDWDKIQKIADRRAKNVVRLLYIYTMDIKMPKSKKHLSRFFNRDISGNSFLINPKGLLKNTAQASFEDIAMYIELASLRNYLDYKWQGIKTLPLKYTDISREKIENNPLMEIDGGDNITFYYEEINNGN